jgi:hypothetical protein
MYNGAWIFHAGLTGVSCAVLYKVGAAQLSRYAAGFRKSGPAVSL